MPRLSDPGHAPPPRTRQTPLPSLSLSLDDAPPASRRHGVRAWALALLLVGAVLAQFASQAVQSPAAAEWTAPGPQWHDDLAEDHERIDFVAERQHVKRTGSKSKSADDALPTAGAIAPPPAPRQTMLRAAQAVTRAAAGDAAYHPRAPPARS